MIKSVCVRKGGVEFWLSTTKLPTGIEVNGQLWTEPIPKELSGHDLNLIRHLAMKFWDTENAAFDLDEWSDKL